MFTVTDEMTFTHPVKMLVPADGGHKPQHFKATFRVLDTDREGAFDLSTAEGSTAFLQAIVTHMDELVGADEQPVPYSDELRDKLIRWPFVRSALVRTYYDAVRKAPEGN